MLEEDIRDPERQCVVLKAGKKKYKREKDRQMRVGTEICPGMGVLKEKFPNTKKHSHWQASGEFWNIRG